MGAPFERVAVLGLGLLGGSVASAARARGVARSVVGVARRADVARRARDRGIVDAAGVDVAAGVADAELVVLATPVSAMSETLRAARSGLAAGALVTDVGSVKASLAEQIPGLLPAGTYYVGAHPMAGGHESGLAHCRADLFEGAACVIAFTSASDPRAVERVESFWRALGARVLRRDPVQHDVEVAWTSHAPHALAFAFARALDAAPAAAHELEGPGFADFIRIAQSDPELWADILVQNRKALAGPLEAGARRLAELARAVESGDAEATHRFLAEARDALARRDERPIRGREPGNPGCAERAAPKE